MGAMDSSATFLTLVDLCPLAMLALDREGMVRLWSPGAERMFGWTEDETLGCPLPIAVDLTDLQLHLGRELICKRKDGVRPPSRTLSAHDVSGSE